MGISLFITCLYIYCDPHFFCGKSKATDFYWREKLVNKDYGLCVFEGRKTMRWESEIGKSLPLELLTSENTDNTVLVSFIQVIKFFINKAHQILFSLHLKTMVRYPYKSSKTAVGRRDREIQYMKNDRPELWAGGNDVLQRPTDLEFMSYWLYASFAKWTNTSRALLEHQEMCWAWWWIVVLRGRHMKSSIVCCVGGTRPSLNLSYAGSVQYIKYNS
jgi:hypothetical protein